MYSLHDFKYPSDWIEPPASDKCIYTCYKEAVDFKLFEENKKTLEYYYGTVSSATFLYPLCNYEQLLVVSRYLTVCFVVDDFLESKLTNPDDSRVLIKKLENILMDGEFQDSNNISNIERYVLFFRETSKQFVGEKIEFFNQFLKYMIDWINSINPFNRADNLNNYDSYNFLKKVNSGAIVSLSVSMLLYPNSKVDPKIWINPRFDRFVTNSGYQMAAINDCASYAKEVRNNNHLTNPLHFLQKEVGSFDNAYKMILKFNDEIMKQICEDERILIEECPVDLRDDLKVLTRSMKLIMGGSYSWSSQCSRYVDINSPFIEQRSNDPNVIGYEKIVDKILSPE
ncbi:hypothetical protein ACTA71_005709 [Dictyostelium dimigraforme]